MNFNEICLLENTTIDGNLTLTENFGDNHHIRTICRAGLDNITVFVVDNDRVSHAFGIDIGNTNDVDCVYSGAVGEGLRASECRMFAVGEYNTTPITGDRFVIGCGVANNRSNLASFNDSGITFNAPLTIPGVPNVSASLTNITASVIETQTNDAVAVGYITFVKGDNDDPTAEELLTNDALQYAPGLDLMILEGTFTADDLTITDCTILAGDVLVCGDTVVEEAQIRIDKPTQSGAALIVNGGSSFDVEAGKGFRVSMENTQSLVIDHDNGSVDFCNFPVNIDTTLSLPGIPNVSASIAAGGGGGTIDTSSFALIDEPNTFECNQIFEGNVVIQENFGDSDHHIRTICSDGIGSTTIFDVTNERLFHAFTVNIGLANNVDCNYAGAVGDGLCVKQGRMLAVGQYNTPPLTGDRFVVGGGINSTNETTLLRVCLLYTSPSPRDRTRSRMPSSA